MVSLGVTTCLVSRHKGFSYSTWSKVVSKGTPKDITHGCYSVTAISSFGTATAKAIINKSNH